MFFPRSMTRDSSRSVRTGGAAVPPNGEILLPASRVVNSLHGPIIGRAGVDNQGLEQKKMY